jgi:hypothetical protein
MRRTILTLTAALAALPPAGAAAMAGTGERTARFDVASASVRVVECVRGPVPEDRLAVFRGAMRNMPGAERMWMRFKLQERVGAGRFRTVKAPGIGVWHRSRPGVRRFAYRQRILALAEGSAYRAVVSFRWYAVDGELLRQTKRRSPACRQPGLLPNLRVTRIAGPEPILSGAYRYSVSVANRGPVAAEGFGVSLVVDGGVVGTRTVSALAPGDSRRLVFTGPRCTSTMSAVADLGDAVREVTEQDNVLNSSCSAGA